MEPSWIERHGKRFRVRRQIAGVSIKRSFPTLEEAEAHVLELERRAAHDYAEAALARTSSITVRDLCRRWFTTTSGKFAPGTATNYEMAIRLHITPHVGSCDANQIRDAELEEFYKRCRFDPARKSHQVLRSAFTWGRRNMPELVRPDNPAMYVKPSRRDCIGHDGTYSYDDDDVRPVDEKKIPLPDEVDKLVRDADAYDRAWWMYLELALATAGRPGELCALRRKYVDVAASTVRIEWSADRVSLRVKRPKTRWSIRTLEIPRAVMDRIAPYLPEDPEAFLFPADERRSPMPCWNGRGAYRRLAKALARCGLPHYAPHGFRHYTATQLLAAGVSPTQVARFLGHKDETLVRKLYGNKIVARTRVEITEVISRLVP